MKKILYIFVLLFLSTYVFAWDGHDTTLYWQLKDPGSSVDGGSSVYTFLSIEKPDDDLGVRIAAYDVNGNLIKYLNPVYEYEDHTKEIWEYNDAYIGTGSSIYDTRYQQAYYGRSDIAEVLFQMQIGEYDENDNFISFLYSNNEYLRRDNWYDWGQIDPGQMDWSPTEFFTVNPVMPEAPEPNANRLFLLGLSVLLLKRKSTFVVK